MFRRILPKSEFSRNVLTLMAGTTVAQAIPIAISPILTRLYTPEDFGIFALYMSIASIISVAATARYELAVMLPKKDDDAINIVVLSIIISFFISCVTFGIVFIFNVQITKLLGNPAISKWLYFIPITVLLTGIYQSFNYWLNRKKKYKMLAKNRVVQSATTATANLGIGFGHFGASGLIVGNVFGQLIATSILSKTIWKDDKKKLIVIKSLKIFALTKRYVNFPKYDVLASMSNVSAHQITHILFNSMFGAITAGHFYLTQRILNLPITYIASAVSDVFRQSAVKEYQEFGNAKKIYVSTFKKLFVLSFFPSLLLFLYGVKIFVFVFGEKWKTAGEYATILSPMLFLRFISSPLSFMLYIGEKQNINMMGNILFLLLAGLSFYLSSTARQVVIFLSLSYSFVYVLYLLISFRIAEGK